MPGRRRARSHRSAAAGSADRERRGARSDSRCASSPPAARSTSASRELAEWGIAPEKLSLQSFSGARWLCVEGIGLSYQLDPAQLTLALDFPPELYGGSRESFVMEDRLPVTYAPGGFLNYDLRYDRTEGVTSLGANWEIGAFAPAGTVHLQLLQRRQRSRHDPPRHHVPPRRSGAHHQRRGGRHDHARRQLWRVGAHGRPAVPAQFRHRAAADHLPVGGRGRHRRRAIDGGRLHRQRQGLFHAGQARSVLGAEPAGSGRRRQRESGRARRVRQGNDRGGALRALRLDAQARACTIFPTRPASCAATTRSRATTTATGPRSAPIAMASPTG